jgi:hypothetical protein
MTLRMNFNLEGAANKRKRYSAVNIITHAVSRQKNTILYLSPHDKGPPLGRCPHGTVFMKKVEEKMMMFN